MPTCSGTSTTTVPAAASWSTVQPSRRSSSAITSTSRIAGTLVSSVRPTASSAAAISFSALFLAPSTRDLTHQRRVRHDPKRVHGRPRLGPVGWRHGQPHPDLHPDRRHGTTSLGDFSRTAKTDPRLAAYADVDETNAALGVAVTVGGSAAEES